MFVERVEELLKKRGLHMNKMLLDLGYSSVFWVRTKQRNSIPAADKVCAIAKYLNTSVEYLLGETDSDVSFDVITAKISENELYILQILRALPNDSRQQIESYINGFYSGIRGSK